MSDAINNLTDEQKKEIVDYLNDQRTKLGEVFSQCWESEEFKEAFKKDPKAIFDEYGVKYDAKKEIKILDTPDKTVIHVLPYEGIKAGLTDMYKRLYAGVDDIEDEAGKQIILPGWSYQIMQNTEDTVYMPIPLCPENLSPEELEMVNGGCLALVLVIATVFVAEAEVVGQTTTFATMAEVVTMALAISAAVSLSSVAFVQTVITASSAFTATSSFTGAVVFNGSAAVGGGSEVTDIKPIYR